MPLEETVESLEGISEEYHDLYVQQEDGKFKIDISGLKSAVQKERNLRKKAEKQSTKNVDSTPDFDEVKNKLEEAEKTIKNMKITSELKSAAVTAGVHPEYVDDVLALTKGNFELDEDGSVVHMDAGGEPSGLDAVKFFNNKFKQTKPIYYVNTGRKGGGAQQNLNDGSPLSQEGRERRAIENKNATELVNLRMSKIKK